MQVGKYHFLYSWHISRVAAFQMEYIRVALFYLSHGLCNSLTPSPADETSPSLGLSFPHLLSSARQQKSLVEYQAQCRQDQKSWQCINLIQIPVSLAINCVALSKLITLSVPVPSHIKRGYDRIYLVGFCEDELRSCYTCMHSTKVTCYYPYCNDSIVNWLWVQNRETDKDIVERVMLEPEGWGGFPKQKQNGTDSLCFVICEFRSSS